MNIGTLTIFLGVTTSGLNKAIRDVNRLERTVVSGTANMNAAMMMAGKTMTQFFTFPASIIGGVGLKAFSDFEYELAKVTGLVGIAADQTAAWGEEIKALSPTVAKGPKELAEALYFVTTGGIRGAETMDVLSVASKAAAAGLGETKTVADLLVSAMNAYGKENLSAARAADILIESVKEGKAEADKLAQSMGYVFPVASKLGVSFDQVGAAMAAMTRTGTKASTAAIQTRQILNKIINPAKESEKALKTLGYSFDDLRQSLASQGLLATLMKLNDLTREYGVNVMADIFPNIRALAGVLDMVGENMYENVKSQEAITNSAGALNRAFENVSKTFKFQFLQVISQAKVLFIELGQAIATQVLPIVKSLLDTFARWVEGFTSLNETTQKSIIVITGLLTAFGPLMLILSSLRSVVLIPLIGAYFLLEKGLKSFLDSTIKAEIGLKKFLVTERVGIKVKQESAAANAQAVVSLKALNSAYVRGSGAVQMNTTVIAKQTQALGYSAARYAYMGEVVHLLTYGIGVNTKALDYNHARWARLSMAITKLNAVLPSSNSMIAMNTTAITSNQQALGWNVKRWLHINTALLKTNKVLRSTGGVITMTTSMLTMNDKALGFNELRWRRLSAAHQQTSSILYNTSGALEMLSVTLSANQKALDFNVGRWARLSLAMLKTNKVLASTSGIIVLNTTALTNNQKALGFNEIRWARLSGALARLNMTLGASSGAFALMTTTLSANQKALDYNAGRWAALTQIQNRYNGTVAITIGLMQGQVRATTALVVYQGQLAGALVVLNSQLVLVNRNLALYQAQMIAISRTGKSVLALNAAQTTQLALTAGTVAKTRVAWGLMFSSMLDWFKKVGVAILGFVKSIGIFVARLTLVGAALAGLAIIGTALFGWIRGVREVDAVQENMNKTMLEANRIYQTQAKQVELLANTASNELSSKTLQEQSLKRLIALNPAYLKGLNAQNLKTAEGKQIIDNYLDSLNRKARAEAIYASMAKLEEDRIKALATGADKQLGFWQKAREMGVLYAMGVWKTVGEQHKEALLQVEQAKKAEEDYIKTMENYNSQLVKITSHVGDYAAEYENLRQAVEDSKDMDKSFAQENLANIEAQIRKLKEFAVLMQNEFQLRISNDAQLEDLNKQLDIQKKMAVMQLASGGEVQIATKQQIAFLQNQMEQRKKLLAGDVLEQYRYNKEMIAAYEALSKEERAIIDSKIAQTTYENSDGFKLLKVWGDYTDAMDEARRAAELFGETQIALQDELNITANAIKAAASIPGAKDDGRVKQLQEQHSLLLLLSNTQKEYNTLIDDSADKGMSLVESYEKMYSSQNDVLDLIESAQKAMSGYKLQDIMPDVIREEDLAPLSTLKNIMDDLEKQGLSFLPVYREIKNLIATIGKNEDLKNFAEQMEGINNRIKMLGNSTDLLEAKLSLLQTQWRKLLTGPSDNFEEAIEQLRELQGEILKTQLQLALMEGIKDVFTSLGESIGKFAAGAENSFSGLLDSLLTVVKKIGEVLISVGTAMLFIPELAGKGLKYILAGSAIVAVATATTTALESARDRRNNTEKEVWTGMAQGGVVPQGYPRDTYPAMLTSGEMVVPPKKLNEALFERDDNRMNITIQGEVKGQDIYYVVKEIGRKYENAYGK